MASNRNTSNGPDWKDVTWAAQEYARDWDCFVSLHLRPTGTGKNPVMTVIAAAYQQVSDVGVAKPWASASVILGGNSGGDIAAVALSALYELDKEMYRRQIGISLLRQ